MPGKSIIVKSGQSDENIVKIIGLFTIPIIFNFYIYIYIYKLVFKKNIPLLAPAISSVYLTISSRTKSKSLNFLSLFSPK
jgi:hypothetical protein